MVNNYYTTRDAAKALGVSVRTAQLWLEKGYLQEIALSLWASRVAALV
jgi:predicted site-specific integrase-resolvase